MNRFILYSGLAHAALFMGALTYMATKTEDIKTPVEAVVEMTAPNVSGRSIPAAEEPAIDNGAEEAIPHGDQVSTGANKQEVRERKVRASLPPAPSVPRIVERVEKVTGSKLPTTLPEKKVATKDLPDAPVIKQAESAQDESLPEMGSDIPSIVAEDVDPELRSVEEDTKSDLDAIAAKHLKDLQDSDSFEKAVEPDALPTGPETTGAAPQNDNKNDGASLSDSAALGAKALSEFVQKPGNKRPAYDQSDRLAGRQGTVVFLAFVDNSGTPKDFQMISSSGHRALDLKTLKAVRGWQFQPGQEGWVEIPFQWDLKGGVQEAPSTLRRVGRSLTN